MTLKLFKQFKGEFADVLDTFFSVTRTRVLSNSGLLSRIIDAREAGLVEKIKVG